MSMRIVEPEEGVMLHFWTTFHANHTQTIIGTASFLYLNPFHKTLTLIIVPLHRNLCYHCTIQSDLSLSVRYNLLQV